MESSTNALAAALARLPDREGICPQHGTFMSRNILGKVWSKCPTCNVEADREQEAANKAMVERQHRRLLDGAAIPARFVGRSFESYVASTPAQVHALTTVRDYAENFAQNARGGRSLILAGPPGTGKSHLALAVLQSVLTKNVRYATCMDLIRMVRGTWRPDSARSEEQVLDHLQRLDLLVIDEIGAQYGTDSEQTILFDVIDRRYREVKPLILLTNQDRAGFRTFVGDRTYDRLVETSRWVAFDWPSHRRTAAKEAT